MKDEILSYREMCGRQGKETLQRGMNFKNPPAHGFVLMSRRSNAPYVDELSPDESELIYEGHDASRSAEVINPKLIDQPMFTKSGKLTQNGEFSAWVESFKKGNVPPAVIRVYEKLQPGMWADRGLYLLEDYSYPQESNRKVFKFKLKQAEFDTSASDEASQVELKQSRQIPSHIKVEVFKRDKGRCVECGAQDQLHFDHDFPYSRGGTSVLAENVRILCARHNLAKSAKIE